ncbi:hypothetical protein LguiB_007103 [Lonicera macranthoides]
MASIIPELAYELPPFFKLYKDGKIERLMGTDIIPPGTDPETGVQSKDVVISPETGVSARLYKPKQTNQNQKVPLIIYFHGGGFYVQTPFSSTYQPFLNSLVAESNIIIVSVDYRKAPEHPLPIGYDDCWASIKWVASHSNGGGPEEWINEYANLECTFIMGDSAGANIAHNMAVRVGLDKPSGATIQGLILMHPYFWGKDPVGSESGDVETRSIIENYWKLACPQNSSADDPLMNPKMDPNLARLGCGRVLVFAAEIDFLRCRAWFYHETLMKSKWGGSAEIMESEGEEHVFHLYRPHCEKAIVLRKRVISFINNGEKTISS